MKKYTRKMSVQVKGTYKESDSKWRRQVACFLDRSWIAYVKAVLDAASYIPLTAHLNPIADLKVFEDDIGICLCVMKIIL